MGFTVLFLVAMSTGMAFSVFQPGIDKFEPGKFEPPLPPPFQGIPHGPSPPRGAVAKPGATSNRGSGSTTGIKPPERIDMKEHLNKGHVSAAKKVITLPEELAGLTPAELLKKFGLAQSTLSKEKGGSDGSVGRRPHTFTVPDGNVPPPPPLPFPPKKVPVK